MPHAVLTFIADLHHYSHTLGTKGTAYSLRSSSDAKCLAEAGAIIDASFSKISQSDCDAVLILGDITNNGEKKSHEELKEKLYGLSKSKSIYLLTATHDWCSDNKNNRYAESKVISDVETMRADELYDYYHDFTLKNAISQFKTHIGTYSYTADINERVRILCLNDDKNEQNGPGFSKEHLIWIENEIKKAKQEDKILIGMEHHLIMDHIHPILSAGTVCIDNRNEICTLFADAGLKYMFTGHSHMQGIECFKTKNGNKIYQINVGSLVGYPSPIVNVEVFDEKLNITTTNAEAFIYEGKEYNVLQYTKKHTLNLVNSIMNAAQNSKDEFTSALSASGLPKDKAGLFYYFAHPMAKYVKNLTVKEGYKKLKLFGLAKHLDKNTVMQFQNKPVIEFFYEIFLCVFDGSRQRHKKDSAYYKAVMDFMSILVKLKDTPATRNLLSCIGNIITGNEWDINSTTIG